MMGMLSKKDYYPPLETWYFIEDKKVIRIEHCTEEYADYLGGRLFNRQQITHWARTAPSSGISRETEETPRKLVTISSHKSSEYSAPKAIQPDIVPAYASPAHNRDTSNDKYFESFEKVPFWKRSNALDQFFPNAKEKFAVEIVYDWCY
jgi:hypothetical protein